MKNGDYIFVYGTLKTGHGANSMLQGRSEFVQDDRISGTMYDLGAFPGFKTVGETTAPGEPLAFNGDGPTVFGEVWRITDEALPKMLDRYEGYPQLYDRRRITTEGGLVVWVYEYAGDYVEPKYPMVMSGRW